MLDLCREYVRAALKEVMPDNHFIVGYMVQTTGWEDGVLLVYEATPDIFGDVKGAEALQLRVVSGTIYDASSNHERFDKLASKLLRHLKSKGEAHECAESIDAW